MFRSRFLTKGVVITAFEYHKICAECGQPFVTTSNVRKYCYNKHYRTCVICGKQFEVDPRSNTKTCSPSCRSQYNKQTYHCKCAICGAEFESATPRNHVCSNPHVWKCENCGKEFLTTVYGPHNFRRTCSDECRYALSAKTFAANGSQAGQLAKFTQTCLDRYGVRNPMSLPEIQDKAKATCLAKFGETSFSKTSQFIARCKETNQTRYGVDWEAQTENHRMRIRTRCQSDYGVSNPSMSPAALAKLMHDPSKIDNLLDFRADPVNYINREFDAKPTLKALGDSIGIRESSVSEILRKRGLAHLANFSISKMEEDVLLFLRSVVPQTSIIHNDRNVITPYELDFYLPDYNIGVECDPTATHNSSFGTFGADDYKPPYYHKMKTDKCLERGVFLFHIFGYDWAYHQDVIKSMLCNLLGVNKYRYYARKLSVVELTSKQANDFLVENHRQGPCSASIRLGLVDLSGQLLSVMTFGRSRSTIGSNCCQWELIRFASKRDCSVVGGASKLFAHFINQYYPESIVSFSDRAHTRGNLYLQLGFEKVNVSDPNYCWVDTKTDRAYHRLNAQKRNIKSFLHDDNIDLSKTEKEIMESHGYACVFDSGTIRWEWHSIEGSGNT